MSCAPASAGPPGRSTVVRDLRPLSPQAVGGVLSSLARKGLVEMCGSGGDDEEVWMTEAGRDETVKVMEAAHATS